MGNLQDLTPQLLDPDHSFIHDRSQIMTFLLITILLSSLLSTITANGHFTNTTGVIRCRLDLECGVHGSCAKPDSGEALSVCVCESPWINLIEGDVQYPCAYSGVSRLNVMISSLLGGIFGVDWFILSRGTNLSYIYVGLSKLFTFGGFGAWWLYDFLRLATGGFSDGNGMPLFSDL